MSSLGGGLWTELPEDFREKLAEAARRARGRFPYPEAARPARDGFPCPGTAGAGDVLPPCDAVSTPHGPSLVRSLMITPEAAGFQDTFRKLSALRVVLSSEGGTDPDVEILASRGLERAVFLDLETTGFASSPLFLAGTLTVEDGRLSVRQFFAKDYSQEKSVLHQVSDVLGRYEILITFNGKSYDVPFLRDRFCYHGLRFDTPPHHLDLLHPARRRWRHEFPNCRLITLEWHLCGRRRFGDIPGSEIPAVYHEFVKRGYSHAMKDVFHHNVLDLVTLAELLSELAWGAKGREHAAERPGTKTVESDSSVQS